MTTSTWNSFKWWYSVWCWVSIVEAVVIVAIIIYIGKNRWGSIGKAILYGLKNVNAAINKFQQEQYRRKEISVFNIGKFWLFVIGGLFTALASFAVFVVGYFAAVGYGIATSNSTELVQIAASNDLLSRMHFIQMALLVIWVISILVIFRSYIELLWQKMKEKGRVKGFQKPINPLVFRWLRYLILFLFTTVCLIALYDLGILVPLSVAGNNALTYDVARTLPENSLAAMWCNLAGAINPFAYLFLTWWICCFWLAAFSYLLKYELRLFLCKIVSIPREIWKFLREGKNA